MKRLDLDDSDIRIALLLYDVRHGRRLPASEESMAGGMQRGLQEQELVAQFRL